MNIQSTPLISKRNTVRRIPTDGGTAIEKTFTQIQDMKREVQLLSLLGTSGCNVPQILKQTETSLILEDLGDQTLLAWYEELEGENRDDYQPLLLDLTQWLRRFYAITASHFGIPYILFDINFRNFLLWKGQIYGIDFEQARPGEIAADAGRLLAYAQSYDPADTPWKMRFSSTLFQLLHRELHIPQDLLERHRSIAHVELCARRKQKK